MSAEELAREGDPPTNRLRHRKTGTVHALRWGWLPACGWAWNNGCGNAEVAAQDAEVTCRQCLPWVAR